MSTNVIAYLVALNEFTKTAFKSPHNTNRYQGPAPTNSTGEHTPTPDLSEHCIELSFSHAPRSYRKGFVLGSDDKLCDIYLGEKRSCISRKHCFITFDQQGYVILRDDSKYGSIVTFDGMASNERRKDFTWVIMHSFKCIEVKIGLDCAFEIRLPDHSDLRKYIELRRNFTKAGEAEDCAIPRLDLLDLQSQISTNLPSGTQTPTTRKLYVALKRIGRGNFANVWTVCDISTGLRYAGKEFYKYGKNFDAVRAEADVLRRLSHKHIVRFVDFQDQETGPLLVMEYLPLGHIHNVHQESNINEEETVEILRQSLEALVYIHSYGFAHRDIKPSNILVARRPPLLIKLADFGEAKRADELSTNTGTLTYKAPEVPSRTYTSAVDIWSLGVVVLEYGYTLPKQSSLGWCATIVDSAEDWDHDDLIDLLRKHMLVLDANSRSSAACCLQHARSLRGVDNTKPGQVQTTYKSYPRPPNELSLEPTVRFASSVYTAVKQRQDSI